MGARDFGNKVHAIIAKIINDQNDPRLFAETSYDPITDTEGNYGAEGSIRLDVLEDSSHSTVYVYDRKTGEARLRAARAVDIASVFQRLYPGTLRSIMI